MSSKKRIVSNKNLPPFTDKDYNLPEKAIVFGELLGKGNFSKVFKGVYQGQTVAIKKCDLTDEGLTKYVKDELAILKRVKHPGIIKYVGACIPEKKDMVYIVTEYVPGGDLRMLLNRKDYQLGWKKRTDILRQVADAMLYLHERDLLHRDIKTDNIMLTLNLHAKLIDLGFARLKSPDTKRPMTMCGTDEFMSPEVLFGMPYDERADVFSFGIVIAEVVTKKAPGKATKFLDRKPRGGFCVNMEELDTEFAKVKCPSELSICCKECCADEAEDRPTTDILFDWLSKIYEETVDDSKNALPLAEETILREINEKWEYILKNGEAEDSKLALDEDDFTGKFAALLEGSRKDGGSGSRNGDKVERNMSMQERRRSVRRGVRETATLREKGTVNDRNIITGYLWKKGGNWKTWKKRYMILTKEGMFYYKNKESFDKEPEHPQGALLYLDMFSSEGHPAAETVSVVAAGKRNAFHILTKSRKRYIAASSESEAEEWVRHINTGLKAWQENLKRLNR